MNLSKHKVLSKIFSPAAHNFPTHKKHTTVQTSYNPYNIIVNVLLTHEKLEAYVAHLEHSSRKLKRKC